MAESSGTTPARGGARWVSLRRACEILGVDESTIRRWADTGRLRVYRTPGGHRRFSLGNLEEMVAGEGKHRGSDEVERIAVAKIRRHLQRARQQEHGWYATLSDSNRQEIGEAYGSVLMDAGLPLPSAVGAYIGFRKTIDETTRQTASRESLPVEEALEAMGQVHALGDQVLLGMASAYEASITSSDS